MLRVQLARELLADDGRSEGVDASVAGDVAGARGPLKHESNESLLYSEVSTKTPRGFMKL